MVSIKICGTESSCGIFCDRVSGSASHSINFFYFYVFILYFSYLFYIFFLLDKNPMAHKLIPMLQKTARGKIAAIMVSDYKLDIFFFFNCKVDTIDFSTLLRLPCIIDLFSAFLSSNAGIIIGVVEWSTSLLFR